jgi:hypothetical protein
MRWHGSRIEQASVMESLLWSGMQAWINTAMLFGTACVTVVGSELLLAIISPAVTRDPAVAFLLMSRLS